MNAREEILSRIKNALQDTEKRPDARASDVAGRHNPDLLDQSSLTAKFRFEIEKVGGVLIEGDAANALQNLLENVKTVVCWNEVSSECPWLNEIFLNADVEVFTEQNAPGKTEFMRLCERADIGMTTVDFAVAETGTLCLRGGGGRSCAVSLLPPIHVALVRKENLVSNLAEIFSLLEAAPTADFPASAITFITGPSRTADIELKLVVGVHGAQQLYVVLY